VIVNGPFENDATAEHVTLIRAVAHPHPAEERLGGEGQLIPDATDVMYLGIDR
jgi:hypothetical protein